MLLGPFIFQTRLGYLPLDVTRIRSLALTSLIVRYLLSGLMQELMAFSATMPSGFLIMFWMKLVCQVACFISLVGVFAEWHVGVFCSVLFVLLLYRFYLDVLFLEVYLCFCDVLFVFVLIDLVKDALQPNFHHVEDSCLKTLLQNLLAVLFNSKTANTNKKYERGFNAWRKWASQFKEIVIFPASSVYVFSFLV